MIDAIQLEPLRARRAQIQKRTFDLGNRMAKLDHERTLLQQELEAIETTLSTLAKVYGVELSTEPEIKAGKSTGGNTTKPESAPTLFEMVEIIFDEWRLLDDLHEGQEIYDEIKRKWWPDAPRNSIIPSLWRFANENRIRKDGTRYGPLLKDETPGVDAPGASRFEEDIDDDIPF